MPRQSSASMQMKRGCCACASVGGYAMEAEIPVFFSAGAELLAIVKDETNAGLFLHGCSYTPRTRSECAETTSTWLGEQGAPNLEHKNETL